MKYIGPISVPYTSHKKPIWESHGIHIGPIWVAHMGPIWNRFSKTIWDPYGQPRYESHIVTHMEVHMRPIC